MKKILSFVLSSIFVSLSFSAMAETHEGVKPVLRYSHDHDHSVHAKELDSSYLTVVPEEWSFPNGPQKAKFEKALEIMEEVMNSDEFRKKVISYIKSDGTNAFQKPYLWNNSNDTMTNSEVYQLIMEGNEKMRPNTLGEMNLNSWVKVCRWYEKVGVWCRKVIGSTNPGSSKWIKLNWKFYKRYGTPEMVSNMVHEWLHLLGFLHGNENMREEVPYVVGAIAGEVARGILEREE